MPLICPSRSGPMPLVAALLAPAMPYGGQAAIEGVLMKGTQHAALAVRRRDGRIEVMDRATKSSFPWLTSKPIIRGFFILWDMLTLGMWAIRESSRRHELDLIAAEREKREAEGELDEGAAEPPAVTEPPAWLTTVMLVVSLIIALMLFKVLPAMAATGVFSLVGWGPFKEIANPTFGQQFLANMIEGLVKLAIFIGYVWGVGRLKEIQRVFQYHGAEHIVINAYEDNPDNQDLDFIESHTTAHPRCGTSFIVILILASIVLFTVLDWALVLFLPELVVDNLPVWYLRWPLRILGLPLLAGMSYEVVKGAFKYYGKPLITPLLRFGMLFQGLTTRQPDSEQIEVSLASFNRARYLTESIPEPARPERILADQSVA